MENLVLLKDEINQLLARYGVKFGIYKNNEFHEQLFPFDPIPRVIEHEEFEELEKGLIPEEFIFSSPGFLYQCQNIVPPKNIFAHIAGIDLVK